jgi:hypothetical protein
MAEVFTNIILNSTNKFVFISNVVRPPPPPLIRHCRKSHHLNRAMGECGVKILLYSSCPDTVVIHLLSFCLTKRTLFVFSKPIIPVDGNSHLPQCEPS